jgi:hypothetical protein
MRAERARHRGGDRVSARDVSDDEASMAGGQRQPVEDLHAHIDERRGIAENAAGEQPAQESSRADAASARAGARRNRRRRIAGRRDAEREIETIDDRRLQPARERHDPFSLTEIRVTLQGPAFRKG